MRSSASGRNGVGVSKEFFCNACLKSHGSSVERTGIKHLVGKDITICDRQFFKLIKQKNKSEDNKDSGLKKLRKLKSKVKLEDEIGFMSRVEFIKIVLIYRLIDYLKKDDCYQQYKLYDRDYNECFDMDNKELLYFEILTAALTDYWLRLQIEASFDENTQLEMIKAYRKVKEQTT